MVSENPGDATVEPDGGRDGDSRGSAGEGGKTGGGKRSVGRGFRQRLLRMPDRWSFSSRVLAGLAALTLLSTLVLWSAPRIAAVLPPWMAPVASFLTPGGTDAAALVGDLEGSIRLRLDAIDLRLDALEDEDRDRPGRDEVEGMLSAHGESVRQRLEAIEGSVSAAAETRIAERIAAAETRLEAVSSEVSALADLMVSGSPELPAEAVAMIAGQKASVERLEADLAEASARLGEISARQDLLGARLEALEARPPPAAVQPGEVSRTPPPELAEIIAALGTGRSFAAAASALAERNGATLPAALADVAATGTPSLADLRAAFPESAYAAIRAAARAEAGDGFLNRFVAFMRSLVVTRSLEPREGGETDAILSRVDGYLAGGDLGRVLEEAGQLDESAAAAMAPWLADVRRLHGAAEAAVRLSGASVAAE